MKICWVRDWLVYARSPTVCSMLTKSLGSTVPHLRILQISTCLPLCRHYVNLFFISTSTIPRGATEQGRRLLLAYGLEEHSWPQGLRHLVRPEDRGVTPWRVRKQRERWTKLGLHNHPSFKKHHPRSPH